MTYNTSLTIEENAEYMILEEYSSNMSLKPLLIRDVTHSVTRSMGKSATNTVFVMALVNQLVRNAELLKQVGYPNV